MWDPEDISNYVYEDGVLIPSDYALEPAAPIAAAPVYRETTTGNQNVDTGGVDWMQWVAGEASNYLAFQRGVKGAAGGDATVSNKGGELVKDGSPKATATTADDWLKKNQTMLLVGGAVLLVALLLARR